MKIILLGILLLALPTYAGDGAQIKANMDQLGDIFKALGQQVNDPSQNATSAAEAAQIAPLFEGVVNLVPDAVSALSADQQPAALAQYKNFIQQEISDANALTQAFQGEDNSGALRIMSQMLALKKKAHDLFNPQP